MEPAFPVPGSRRGVSDLGPGGGISAAFLLLSGAPRERSREGRSGSRDTLFHGVSPASAPAPPPQALPTAPFLPALEFSSRDQD